MCCLKLCINYKNSQAAQCMQQTEKEMNKVK